MANEVYANDREVSCKAGDGKSICAFPDVCFTPPLTPATPPGVPIPYPNTGMTTDTTSGSKTVKISGKEVMLKDSSYFSTSTGDEAGCAPKKGIITSTIKGKVYFKSWSMDVKFEGENAVRHLDLTTHNHNPGTGQTPPWPFAQKPAKGKIDPCKAEKAKEKKDCEEYKPNKDDGKDVCEEAELTGPVIQENKEAIAAGHKGGSKAWADATAKKAGANKCARARRCQLVPFNGKPDGINGCCPSQTPDHLIPKASFYKKGFKKGAGELLDSWPDYDHNAAPCMCAEGGNATSGSHGLRHAHHKANGPEGGKGTPQTIDQEATRCAQGAATVFKASGCSEACIKAQLINGHKKSGKGSIKYTPSGRKVEKVKAKPFKRKPKKKVRS